MHDLHMINIPCCASHQKTFQQNHMESFSVMEATLNFQSIQELGIFKRAHQSRWSWWLFLMDFKEIVLL